MSLSALFLSFPLSSSFPSAGTNQVAVAPRTHHRANTSLISPPAPISSNRLLVYRSSPSASSTVTHTLNTKLRIKGCTGVLLLSRYSNTSRNPQRLPPSLRQPLAVSCQLSEPPCRLRHKRNTLLLQSLQERDVMVLFSPLRSAGKPCRTQQ